ncbi:MAG: dihydrofolate reductase [Flavobacteriales bacterium]|nr:dihydrofolate reductase [Flavobacteriales bacterium]MBK6756096.1 dihydrofolate reductase [Flavobacteriales bacterium]MBK7083695.1 dihydrofolate reductase [Flavobacteriales bacterium]MBK7269935.1 dihydrofolate reductase [Flavobacteriales bacterium]MBK9077030.1 dihydrofolate reductase [Flavobacteriales bacterium]
MIVSAIAAVSENQVIGRDGDLPWHLPDDMRFFQRTTMGHHVITGRKNWESIPLKYRPLKGRTNVVVTRAADYEAPGALVAGSLEEALEIARKAGEEEAFLIGGGQIYRDAFSKDLVDRVYLTRVHAEIPGDTSFPLLGAAWREVWREEHPADERHGYAFTFLRWEKIPGPP